MSHLQWQICSFVLEFVTLSPFLGSDDFHDCFSVFWDCCNVGHYVCLTRHIKRCTGWSNLTDWDQVRAARPSPEALVFADRTLANEQDSGVGELVMTTSSTA